MPFDMATQIEAWRAQLLDTTKRNRLINFKTGRSRGIQLVHPGPAELWHRLVVAEAGFTFPWKHELIDLPEQADEADAELTPGETEESVDLFTGQDVLERYRQSPRLRNDHLLTELTD